MKKERVWIGVPSYGGMLTARLNQMLLEAGALSYDETHPFEYFPFVLRGHRPVERARNLITRAFMQDPEGSRLWWIDDDMNPPWNWWALARWDVDAVSGIAFGWNSRKIDRGIEIPPRVLTVMYNTDNLGKLVTVGTVLRRPFLVDAVGTGCVLIKRHVFEKVGDPWFVTHYGADGEVLLGEDGHFFTEAHKHGVRVLVDPAIRFGHEKLADTLDIAEYGVECRRQGYEEGFTAGQKGAVIEDEDDPLEGLQARSA